MRYIFVTLFLFPFSCCFGQLSESFSDGQFLTDPAWTGLNPTCDFVVTNNMLRSNNPGEGGIYSLSTSSSLSLNAQWEFLVTLKFNTSGSNFTDIYLIADQADLVSDAINGYFVRIGGAEDEISLHRRSGPLSSAAEIIDGMDGSIDSSDNTIRVRVKRTQDGIFSLEREVMKPGSAFVTEGVAGDLTYTGTTHFGIYIRQSGPSFFYKHFFDDIIIQPIPLDTIPPRLISAFVLDSNTIEVEFDEPVDTVSARSITNFLLAGSSNSLNAVVADFNSTKLRLVYSDPFKSGEYELNVSGISDLNGNPMPEAGKISIHYIRPYKARAGDIIVTEILADPTPAHSLPSSEFIELKNASDEHISLEQWRVGDGIRWSKIADVIIPPGSYLILCAKTDTGEFSRYGLVSGLSSWSGLNNSGETILLSDPEGFVVDSLTYSNNWYGNAEKKQGGWSLERMDLSSLCEPRFNWTASIDSTGGTPGRQNSVHLTGYDMLALKADSLKQTSDTSLTIYFNKHLNEATLIAENFVLEPHGNLNTIIADTGLKEITIHYKETFTANTEYNLAVLNLKDCGGNRLPDTVLIFRTPKAPAPVPERLDTARIFITEIFADPSPEVGLPLVEFIEIYNPGQDTIDLGEWTISDPVSTGKIPNQKILPRQYVILCRAADTLYYETFAKTIGISPWPSLNNASDQIALKSFKGRLVDSLNYSDSWYGNAMKKQGGWSLERIDLYSLCEPRFNWAPSIDSTGGTPGRQNSVYISGYDILALKADSLKQTSDTSLTIYFNKHLDEATLIAENFVLQPHGSFNAITAEAGLRQVTIQYDEIFMAGAEHRLSVLNLKDCSGNMLTDTVLSFHTPGTPVPLPERLDTARIFITEIFADPSPELGLPPVEFIELYNPGQDTIDLDKWTISDPASTGTLRNHLILPKEYLIICPAADTIHYKTFGKTVGVSPWPSLNNSSDQIALRSFKGRLVDSLAYSDSWYRHTSKKQGGWTLEKIYLSPPCESPFNWNASTDPTGGTPGRENSVYARDGISLKTDSLVQNSDTSISIYFNRYLDETTLTAGNFVLGPASGFINEIISDAPTKQLTLTYSQAFASDTQYSLTISGLKDCSGNLVPDTTLIFYTPETPVPVPERPDTAKIIISEIFADPSPEVGLPLVEFIELFNPGQDTIDLDKWTISDAVNTGTIHNQKILPRGYVILCRTADTVHYQTFGKTIGISPWPSLNNASDQLSLRSLKARLVDSVAYSDSWYGDPVKKQGGWSLEIVDFQSICAGAANWKASTSPTGGTPGTQNAVHASASGNEPLRLQGLIQADSASLILYFNRNINSLAVLPGDFSLNNGMGSPAAVHFDSANQSVITIEYSSPIGKGLHYKLSVQNICDCNGQVISAGQGINEFFVPEDLQQGDLLISEILFNPRPGGVDFVEIYNNSGQTVDISQVFISNGIDSTGIQKKLGEEQVLLDSGTYLAVTANPDNIRDEYSIENPDNFLEISSLPPFNDDRGTVTLNTATETLDVFNYLETMHFALLPTFEGVSLERSSLSRQANEAGNFRSASAAAGYATPGYANSQEAVDTNPETQLAVASKTFSPDNDGFEDLLQISYKLAQPGMVANISIFNDKGLLVKKLHKNYTLDSQGILVWDGMDELDTLSPTGIYIMYAEIFDLHGRLKKFRKSFVLASKF